MEDIHPSLWQVSSPQMMVYSRRRIIKKNVKYIRFPQSHTSSLPMESNNHNKEKRVLNENTNKQVLVRAMCDWLPNQWEPKSTVLSHSLKNHTCPGDSYLKCWLYQSFSLFGLYAHSHLSVRLKLLLLVAMIMSTMIKFGIYIQRIEFGIIQQNTQQSFKLRVQILLP